MNKIWKVSMKSRKDGLDHSETVFVSAFTARGATNKALKESPPSKESDSLIIDTEVEYEGVDSLLRTMKE